MLRRSLARLMRFFSAGDFSLLMTMSMPPWVLTVERSNPLLFSPWNCVFGITGSWLRPELDSTT